MAAYVVQSAPPTRDRPDDIAPHSYRHMATAWVAETWVGCDIPEHELPDEFRLIGLASKQDEVNWGDMISVTVPRSYMERGPRPAVREYSEQLVSQEFLHYIDSPLYQRVKQIVRLFHKQPGLLMQVFERLRDVDCLRSKEEKANARRLTRVRRVRGRDGRAKVKKGNKAKAKEKDTARAAERSLERRGRASVEGLDE